MKRKALWLHGMVSEKLKFTGKTKQEIYARRLGEKLGLPCLRNLGKEISSVLQCVVKKVNTETLLLSVVSDSVEQDVYSCSISLLSQRSSLRCAGDGFPQGASHLRWTFPLFELLMWLKDWRGETLCVGLVPSSRVRTLFSEGDLIC